MECLDVWTILEPESSPVRMSTMRARPYPFGPPIGRRVPFIAAAGSVVGAPVSSRAHPSGIASFIRSARRILPRATMLDDMSRTTGASEPPGTAMERGFVPKNGSIPPQAGMAGPHCS